MKKNKDFFDKLVGKKLDINVTLEELISTRYSRGAVYRAYETIPYTSEKGNEIAVKILLPNKDSNINKILHRLRVEKVQADRLRGVRGIAGIQTYGRDSFRGRAFCYLVMDFVPHYSLAQRLIYLHDRPLMGDILLILQDLSNTLIEVHNHGIFHGDVKPSNIVFYDDTPYIIDFGISNSFGDVIAPKNSTSLFSYMALEQIIQESPPNQKGDVYSLGAVAYELITMQPPYHIIGYDPHEVRETQRHLIQNYGGEISSDCKAILIDALEQHRVRDGDKNEIIDVLIRALAADVDKRFRNVEEFLYHFKIALEPYRDDMSAFCTSIPSVLEEIENGIQVDKTNTTEAISPQSRIDYLLVFVLTLILSTIIILFVLFIIPNFIQRSSATPGALTVIGVTGTSSLSNIVVPTTTVQQASVASESVDIASVSSATFTFSNTLVPTNSSMPASSPSVIETPTGIYAPTDIPTFTHVPIQPTNTLTLPPTVSPILTSTPLPTSTYKPTPTFTLTLTNAHTSLPSSTPTLPAIIETMAPNHTASFGVSPTISSSPISQISPNYVTNGQYRVCYDEGSCVRFLPANIGRYVDPTYETYPILTLNWMGAMNYCQYKGGRLPTESEWQEAQRQDKLNVQSGLFEWLLPENWSDDWDDEELRRRYMPLIDRFGTEYLLGGQTQENVAFRCVS